MLAFAAGMIWVFWQVQVSGERVAVQSEYFAVGFLVLRRGMDGLVFA